MDDPEQPVTVSLKPARRAPRPDANWNRLVRLALFLNYFDLFIDHLPGELIDCNVHPVMLLAFNNEIVLEACCVWLIATQLCYHIDQQIPDMRLRNGRNCPRNNFPSSLRSLIVLRSRR